MAHRRFQMEFFSSRGNNLVGFSLQCFLLSPPFHAPRSHTLPNSLMTKMLPYYLAKAPGRIILLISLQWRGNERHGVSNRRRRLDCLTLDLPEGVKFNKVCLHISIVDTNNPYITSFSIFITIPSHHYFPPSVLLLTRNYSLDKTTNC